MAQDPSFDIVSKLDRPELQNAVSQAMTEIQTRFDFKGSNSEIKITDDQLVLTSENEIKLKQVIDVLTTKMAKRGISLKAFDFDSKVEPATGQTVRMKVKIQNGLDKEQTKQITTLIKDQKLKVQATIQGDSVRVVGKKKDDLQEVMAAIRNANFNFDANFTNFKG
ncbi:MULTISPECIES: YajQ family cyclic di-GMP-binding protein [Leptospira]|uniref:Nucleotide-binding protein EHQ60_17650 n=2 Tax=Leptospira TaxID=171 RepID=A0ABY2MJD2_9LEPT|nr:MULTISPECIES: YajQ family cyclic di-GMP-binding protein [Leptospira]PKA27255.1 YajQ family cyclic di-GMP-binding protein [Leptospira sp. mixed culture ATI2-C-A1]MBL0956218.1 YajQ family cyclic di-GMP-binding protein [Leptospira sp.]MCG6148602.1 YajQ family cyclic di-GMP-binding protein [Leptospira levettii]MCW7495810.1 YajQ family cyclic di-GMP-binding protein [Leptospira levettii]MCW7504401.1 YajQ family cyclic di-GMP-binding protein [Leptospira paudalimensis]